ncbi:MAG TPA: hypothetical protein ENK18_25720, partial [Deltaproteobacteria bacterium]|nr:hypothetical protein [Deltaproteobacteria bacterium]
GPGLFDDFEAGARDPLVWSEHSGDLTYETAQAHTGSYSLHLGGGGALARSVHADLSVCGSVEWSYRVKRGPSAPGLGDALVLSWSDGAAWIEADRVLGDGTVDADFALRAGVIHAPAALHSGFQLQLVTDGPGIPSADDFYVDELEVRCGGPDADGDGVPSGFDCDDADPLHWSDCGLCVDADGDGYGIGCDLGADCRDTDPTIHPGIQLDPPGDGIDADCDLLDGPGIADTFEAGDTDATTWGSMTGDYAYVGAPVYAGSYALNLTGPAGMARSVAFDTSGCTEVVWSYQGKRGPDAPSFGDDLVLSYDDGTSWREIDRYPGQDVTDAGYSLRWGSITDPLALHSSFRVQLAGTGYINDDYFIDQLVVTCSSGDSDGDGIPSGVDCNDSDPAHFSDCLLCIDGDGDGYGIGCDLGDDCAPTDPGISPGAADPYGDGLDTNCDGLDGDALFDDFELGVARPDVWSNLWPAVAIVSTQSASGGWSMNLDGFVQATTTTLDTSSCPAVLWRYQGKRGPSAPATGSDLHLTYWDGTSYVITDTLAGDYTEDPDFVERFGVITDPAALSTSFSMRFDTTSFIAGNDFYVDDLVVGCTDADTDGDGYPSAIDCDPIDGDHWSDCGLCVDVDGDGFGSSCDLGADCDDSDAAIQPQAADPFGDGIDSDCDGIDGPVLFDDFELGVPDPSVWTPGSGSILVTPGQAWSGSYSLDLDGSGVGTILESQPLDTSSCPALLWSYEGKRGPDAPAPGDDLLLSYDDGGSWVPVDTLTGDGTSDVDFGLRFGVIADPTALWPGFRIRVENTALVSGNDHYLDDVTVICTEPDGDGDGYPKAIDCDDTDPWRWLDCGVCVDVDGDGAGTSCDPGPDCDDHDATVYPGAPDAPGDGLDDDCSGVDGVGIFDDFELGSPGPWWASAIGDQTHTTSSASSGSYSLILGGGGGQLESIVLDTSSCTQLAWSMQVKRGPDAPESDDLLVLEYHDGVDWVRLHAVAGDGTLDPAFVPQAGSTSAPAALHSALRVRLRSSGSTSNTDDFYVDELSIGCP